MSLAYIFMLAAFGTALFHLPYKFANAEVPILAYILPTISLSLPSIGSLMKWMRRYMIDQMNSDYVKFAKAKGLNKSEIFRNHIFKNAVIPIAHGIPTSLAGCITGALITESVYAVGGMGKLLPEYGPLLRRARFSAGRILQARPRGRKRKGGRMGA